MSNKLGLPEDKELASKIIDATNEKEKKKLEVGFLGQIWGASSSVPNNIAALTIFILLMLGIIKTFCTENIEDIKLLWSIISPIITLSFGYLCGEKTKKE